MIDKNFIEHRWREYYKSIPLGEKERELVFNSLGDLKSCVVTGYQLNRENELPVRFGFETDYENLKATLKIQTR